MASSLEVEAGPRELGAEAQSRHSGKGRLCKAEGSFKLPSLLGRLPEATGIAVVQSSLREAEYYIFIILLLLFSSSFTNFLF